MNNQNSNNLSAAADSLRDMEQRKDAAYSERNQVVAALAKCFPSGVGKTAIEGWSEDWRGPTGSKGRANGYRICPRGRARVIGE